MTKSSASTVRTFEFESFTIQQGPSDSPLIHLPELSFGKLRDEVIESESKNPRAVVMQVASRPGLPYFGLVRGNALFLELERAQFVRLIQVLRTAGGVKLRLQLGERQDIIALDIVDPRVKEVASSDFHELLPSGTEC